MRLKLFALALLAALATHLSMPAGPAPWLGWIALLPLLVALEWLRPGPRAGTLYLALPYGLCFGFLTFRWMFDLAPAADVTVPGIMFPAVLLWVLYLTFYPWVFIRVLIALRSRAGDWTWLLAPLIWCGLEWLKGSGVLAFTWVHLAQSQAAPGGYLAPAAWIGGLGLGFLMVAAQAGLAVLLCGGKRRRHSGLAYTGAVLLLLLLSALPSARGGGGAPLKVAAIQGNISLDDKWESHFRMENLRIFRELSEDAADQGAELIVWPETAFPVNLLYDRRAERDLRSAAMDLGTDILTGFQALAPDAAGGYSYRNAAGLIRANGAIDGIYGKEHLLPFGEEIPLADLLAPGLDIDLGQSNFTRGSGVRVFRGGAVPFAVFICYEMGFAGSAREATAQGARLLVNITNDGWFDHPLAMELHAALSPMRAAECGLPVVRCGNNGITEILDARGRRLAHLPSNEEGILVQELMAGGEPSYYAKHGRWSSPLLWALYGFFAVSFGLLRRDGVNA